MYGALANGGAVEGVRLVSPERIDAMRRLQTDLPDRVLPGALPVPKAIGYWLGGTWAPGGGPSMMGARHTAFGHPGNGGSVAWADPEVGLAVAVTLNKPQADSFAGGTAFQVRALIRRELGLDDR